MTDDQSEHSTVNLDTSLLKDAQTLLDRKPASVEDVIEGWARLGQVVASQLTEREQMLVLLGSGFVKVIEPE
ncbi:hypothetical protein [Idiomarina ramblicola]|uniref:Uncharacterized protein n=1 Tax=Idiomarina ramblicola TaxID=263724 RepID=A0A432YY69_9GAMM|nr:hypothetical protein [Idiomarina ramblicola]RUO68344.1 hypothetical protein CWI78_08990 [Idiomarina ramblicola]